MESGEFYTGTGYSPNAADAKGYRTKIEATRAAAKLDANTYVDAFPAVHQW
jgi:hypothetical protein